MHKAFLLKEKEIAFGGEDNPDALFQLFQIYESCPVQKFQEAISELRRKHDRRDPSIKKEHLMAEALSSCDTLFLEKKWITRYPKSVAFASFVCKVSSFLDKLDNSNHTKDKSKKKKFKTKTDTPRHDSWKFEKPKDSVPRTKVVKERTFHWCDEPNGKEGKPMWAIHKPSEHKDISKPNPKTSDIELAATNELHSLLEICHKDF